MKMATSSANVKASASFEVRPVRSQVVLVGLTVTAIVALLLGAALLSQDKYSGFLFLVISVALCSVITWCWLKSQRDTDLAQSPPAKVVLANGANVSLDNRLLGSPDTFRSLSNIIEVLSVRVPLPAPAGLTGDDAIPIPNSRQAAEDKVIVFNAEVQKCNDQVVAVMQDKLAGDFDLRTTTVEFKGVNSVSTFDAQDAVFKSAAPPFTPV